MSASFMDIQKVVEEWAWDKYDVSPTRKQKALRKKQLRKNAPYIGLTIDWSDCEFSDTTTWSKIADEDGNNQAENDTTTQNATAASAGTGSPGVRAASVTGSDVNVLFHTEFTNKTTSPQVYTMRVEKTTRSTCCTEVESGVTKGFELGVSLKLPNEVLEMNAGYKREVTLTNATGESFEEELHWGAESEIHVDPRHVADAQLLVREKKQSGDFRVVTRIRGYVGVSFTNLRDNNSFLKRADGDISYVVSKFLQKKQKLGDVYPFITVDDDSGVVIVTSKGTCKFRYGVKQEVTVDQTPL